MSTIALPVLCTDELKMAIQYTSRSITRGEGIRQVHIFSDSQSDVGQLSLGWECKSHRTTVQEVITEMRRLEEVNAKVALSWSPGHAAIKGMNTRIERSDTRGKGG